MSVISDDIFQVHDEEVDVPKHAHAPGSGRKAAPNPLQDMVNTLLIGGKARTLTIPGKAVYGGKDGNPALGKCRRLLQAAGLKYSNPNAPGVDQITVRWDFKPTDDGKVLITIWARPKSTRKTDVNDETVNTVK